MGILKYQAVSILIQVSIWTAEVILDSVMPQIVSYLHIISNQSNDTFSLPVKQSDIDFS